jgi:DNA repair photolyase
MTAGVLMRVVQIDRGAVVETCGLDLFNHQVDPYVGCAHHCVYCYTRNDAPLDWENEVGILPGLERRIETELAGIPAQTVYMGMNTDPYQPAEAELIQTRVVLEALRRAGHSVCLLTKSDLVLRDVDLIRLMPGSSVGFSAAFADEGARKALEGNTISLEARIEALAKLREAGIETYALIDPVFPGITDVDALIHRVAPYVAALWIYPLQMVCRDDFNWRATRDVLGRHFPEALADVERAAFDPEDEFWAGLRRDLEKRADGVGARLEIHV